MRFEQTSAHLVLYFAAARVALALPMLSGLRKSRSNVHWLSQWHTRSILSRWAKAQTSCLLVCVVGSLVGAALGQEFAIENQVTRSSQDGPKTQSVTRTIITPEAFYDVWYDGKEPSEVSVYLISRKQFKLVSFRKTQNTTIDEADVLEFVANVNQTAKSHRDPHVQFAAKPQFVNKSNSAAVHLEHKLWEYTAQLEKPLDQPCLDSYRQFADTFARLNVFWSYPPGARLELNKAIYDRGRLPSRVEVQLNDSNGQPKVSQTTTHRYSWKLQQADRKIVDMTKQAIVEFKPVSFDEFLADR
ncbi:MAG: hypothetical protein KDB27_36345 [Planctomycetales bacterium]|nr:hypothetical protein [Planctomycetales bacterium]